MAILGLLETHAQFSIVGNLIHNISPLLHWWGNYDHCSDGRILIIWDTNMADLTILSSSEQYAHCKVFIKNIQLTIEITFVYAYNLGSQRQQLWTDLVNISGAIVSPWLCLGDFNIIRYFSERQSSVDPNLNDMNDFSSCLHTCALDDVPFIGQFFT